MPCRAATPPVEFLAPTAHPDTGAHSSGICLVPVSVRLQGFAPSCRVPSPASPRPVRAGNAHGVPPSKPSPPTEPWAPLGVRCPPAVGSPDGRRGTRCHIQIQDRPDFRALLPAGIRGGKAGVSRPSARCSPGVFRALGLDHRCVADGFPSAPPPDFAGSAMWRLRRSPGVSIRNGARLPRGCRNPCALSAPRLASACFEPRRSGLAPTGPVTSLLR